MADVHCSHGCGWWYQAPQAVAEEYVRRHEKRAHGEVRLKPEEVQDAEDSTEFQLTQLGCAMNALKNGNHVISAAHSLIYIGHQLKRIADKVEGVTRTDMSGNLLVATEDVEP